MYRDIWDIWQNGKPVEKSLSDDAEEKSSGPRHKQLRRLHSLFTTPAVWQKTKSVKPDFMVG